MKFVSEDIIDKVVASMQDLNDYEEQINILKDKQPLVLAYLLSENFDVLTKDEKEYLVYLTLVIIKSAQIENPDLEEIEEEELGTAEEKNYELMQESKKRNFRDKLDVFFDNYAQEDLLAFVEDAIAIDEEEEESNDFFQVTSEGREPIFIAAKSIIDCL